MKTILCGILPLFVLACGGRGSSNDADVGAHRGAPSQGAPSQAPPHDARADASSCPDPDATTPWSVFPKPSMAGGVETYLNGVWGSGPDDVWAVGNTGPRLDDPAVLHWNGSAWSVSPVPSLVGGVTYGLSGVWGSGPNDVWAVGGGTCCAGLGVGVVPSSWAAVLHWDGTAWSTSPIPPTHEVLGAIWGSGPNDVWGVGGLGGAALYTGSQDGQTLLHWDGSAWSALPLPREKGGTGGGAYLLGVWGTGPNDVWAVGALDDGVDLIDHFGGTPWAISSIGTTGARALGIWGSEPSDVWAVGLFGTIQHWSGSRWSVSSSPTKLDLTSVWGSGASDVWAVGSEGEILHWNGTVWAASPVEGGTTADLTGVWGSRSCDVWAVGANGTILHHSVARP